jgi:hypothetical protein
MRGGALSLKNGRAKFAYGGSALLLGFLMGTAGGYLGSHLSPTTAAGELEVHLTAEGPAIPRWDRSDISEHPKAKADLLLEVVPASGSLVTRRLRPAVPPSTDHLLLPPKPAALTTPESVASIVEEKEALSEVPEGLPSGPLNLLPSGFLGAETGAGVISGTRPQTLQQRTSPAARTTARAATGSNSLGGAMSGVGGKAGGTSGIGGKAAGALGL